MTTGYMTLIGFVAVISLVSLEICWKSWRSGRAFCIPLPRPYQNRESQDDIWRQRYRGGKLTTADVVLKMFCDAFAFNPKDRYKFVPDDRIMDIYQSVYPRWRFWLACDSMEIESFMMDLDKEFGIEVPQESCDITLGEIVDRAVKRGKEGDAAE
jgi:hypothetical protein